MKTHIKTLAILSALALAVPVQALAQVYANPYPVTSWLGTPTFMTGPAPTTGSGGTSQDNDNWAASSLGGVNGLGSLAETFYLTSGGTLQNIQMVFAGASATFNIELYDLGTLASVTAALGSYPTTTAQMNFGSDLLQAGDQFTYGGCTTTTNVVLTFGGTDGSITLQANEVYALALDPTASATGTWWVRGGVPVAGYMQGMGWNTDSTSYAYAYQNFEGKSGGTSGIRNMDTAVTVVPEPASMTLLGLSVLVGGILIRRRQKA